MSQHKAPLWEALFQHQQTHSAQFHIPGHHSGAGLSAEWLELAGQAFFAMDLTEIPGLDDLHNPQGVIAEAQDLAAQVFGAEKSFFLVNGTSCGLEALLLACCKEGDSVIIPRNAHRSVLGGLILSGAKPIYYQPQMIADFGCLGGPDTTQIKKILAENNEAKALLAINPTYYGACGDLVAVAKECHRMGVPLLVDEAHGSHLAFHRNLPADALSCGADAVVQSIHKTGGSFTQSSLLHLQGERVAAGRVAEALRLVQSTSPSYLLMASLDLARRQLALRGEALLEETLQLACWCRDKLTRIPGVRVLGRTDLANTSKVFLDETRLTISLLELGFTGTRTAEILHRKYGVVVEMADYASVVAVLSLGTTPQDCERLVEAIRTMALEAPGIRLTLPETLLLPAPSVMMSPREAWQRQSRPILLEESLGTVSGEIISVYPPGIPVLCPGEKITQQVLDYLQEVRERGYQLQGPRDPALQTIRVLI